MAKPKVKLVGSMDQIRAQDSSWLTLGDLREVVRQADANGWGDGSLVSHTAGGTDHPNLRYMRTATKIIVEGPV